MKKNVLPFVILCILSVSCNKDNSEGHINCTAQIGVQLSDVPTTRSDTDEGSLFDSFLIDDIDGQEIRIDGYVSDSKPFAEYESVQTKGSIITTTGIREFAMTSFVNAPWHDNQKSDGEHGSLSDPYDDSDNPYFDAVTVSKDDSDEWSISDEPNWINNTEMTFWSWKGTEPSISGSTSYDYSSASIDDYTNYGQTDLIYAFNKEKRKYNEKTGEIEEGTGTYNTSYKDKMDIYFYHALATVRFDVSDLIKNGIQIKKITLKGVVKQADCDITVGTGNVLSFEWTPTSTTGNTTSISTGDLGEDDFTEKGLDTEETDDALMSLESDKLLFLIPQDVEDQGITIEIVYENTAGDEVTKEASLNHDTPWKAGKYYTYRLSIDSEVSVTVTDKVTATLKSDVSIKNDGGKSAFIRASIVAYWVDASGNYLSSCDYKTEGTLVGLATGNWSEEADGFFYYNDEVEPGDDIGPSLLTSYAPAAAPITGATLRMVITAQAIEYDSTIASCYAAFNN